METLIKSADNSYKKYIIGGLLFDIDANKSFQLHKEAFQSNNTNENFVLEYAIELHRKGSYKEAIALYEKYAETEVDDYRTYVWLADCYINLGETKNLLTIGQKPTILKTIQELTLLYIPFTETLTN